LIIEVGYMASAAQKRAQKKYDLTHTKQVLFKLNLIHDADIIEKLTSEPNRQGYIKELVRRDIKSGNRVLTTDAIRLLVLPFCKKFKVDKLYLFGSYARENSTKKSDIDLLVSGGEINNLYDYNEAVEFLENALGKKVDLMMSKSLDRDKSRAGKSLRSNIYKERILIYDSNE